MPCGETSVRMIQRQILNLGRGGDEPLQLTWRTHIFLRENLSAHALLRTSLRCAGSFNPHIYSMWYPDTWKKKMLPTIPGKQGMLPAIKPSATAATPTVCHEGFSSWRKTGHWPYIVKMCLLLFSR